MKKLLLAIMFLLPFLVTAQKKEYNPLSLFSFNANGYVTDTSDINISLYLPNDIITIMPSKTLNDRWLWTFFSEVGNVIHTITCECEMRPFLEMLTNYPADKEDAKNIEQFYTDLIKERWYE